MIEEMKQVTKLKQDVAELTRLKDNLALSASALRAALRSFGRPLPAGLVTGDDRPPPARDASSNATAKGDIPSLGSAGTSTDLQPGQQGYIRVPIEREVQECSQDEGANAAQKPAAWSTFFSHQKTPGIFVEVFHSL